LGHGSSTPNPGPQSQLLGRGNVGSRSFQPVLQKRDRGRVVRGPSASVPRSCSSDRGRSKVLPFRRPCRTVSPPDTSRVAASTSVGTGTGAAMKGVCNERDRSAHRFRGHMGNGPEKKKEEMHKPLCPSAPSEAEHLAHGYVPSIFPLAAIASELSGTPRSPPPSNSKASRSTPSTVPHIGSPGSRRESPGVPDLAAPGRCEDGSVFDGAKLKGCLFEAEPVCFNGGNADFVHVDECELPNQVQMLTPVQGSLMESFVLMPNEPNESSGFVLIPNELMPNESSGEGSSVSFNLSPIKRPAANGGKDTVASAPDADCNARCGQVLDTENQGNLANFIPASESKVAAMCSLWEQKLGAATSVVVARGTTGTRGRSSSSARALIHEKVRSRGVSAEACLQKLTAQEDKTKRATHCMDEVLRELRFAGGLSDPRSPLSESSISENSESSIGDNSQDSPSAKVFRGLHRNNKKMWRSTRLVTKALISVLKDEATLEVARSAAGNNTTSLSNAIGGLRRELLIDLVEIPALDEQSALHEKELIASTKLTPTPGMELKSDGAPKPESPPALALTQPEEEADGPLPIGMNLLTSVPRKSKRLSTDPSERAVVEGSRQSTISDVEPAREPQPLESPRHSAVAELSLSSSTPSLESPGEPASFSPTRPSVSGPEHEEFVTTEAESSMESSGSGDPLEDEEFLDFSHIQPCEDGMDRQTTMLHLLEQNELRREIHIIVPEGMGEDRKVTFTFEDKQHEIVVPDGYEVRQQVLVTLTSRPFLERTAALASRRGHTSHEFPDRWYIIDNLRHSLRTDKDNSRLDNQEFKYRYQLYSMLRGKAATPLLSVLPEDNELA